MLRKLALIGGSDIAKYTVADKMWGSISEVSGINFDFEIIPLATEQDARAFFERYVGDQTFIGFNVALPWKQYFATNISSGKFSRQSIINTIYKHGHRICGLNTDPLGVVRGLNDSDLQSKLVLILGAGGAGQATAAYMAQELGAKVYVYDIADRSKDVSGGKWVRDFGDLKSRKYDVIINATPLGKFYLDSPIESFTSPVDITTLRDISHNKTVLQEMNYLPLDTLFLQSGKALGLSTVPGVNMLVFQAVESFKSYFDKELSAEQISLILDTMQKHILVQESAILSYRQSSKGAIDGCITGKI